MPYRVIIILYIRDKIKILRQYKITLYFNNIYIYIKIYIALKEKIFILFILSILFIRALKLIFNYLIK
jgi:hypothetical protein